NSVAESVDVLEVVRNRRSIRSYADRAVEDEALRRVLEAGRLAPSASNRQAWRFIVVTDPQRRQGLARAAAAQQFVAQAPVVLVACTEMREGQRFELGSCLIDVTIAVTQMALQAVAEGLGTCWVTRFYEAQVKQILGIPDEVHAVQLLTIGYPSEEPEPQSRLPLEKIVRRETW
ncbi:MAG: nitroreductase family protein, partial [Planctomycetota bacterium]